MASHNSYSLHGRPVGSEVSIVEPMHLRGQPGMDVDAVGDVPDGHFFFAAARIERAPHRA